MYFLCYIPCCILRHNRTFVLYYNFAFIEMFI